jgi:thioredoxin reductase (NADPH)
MHLSTILVVSDDLAMRDRLVADLSARFDRDYEVVGAGSSEVVRDGALVTPYERLAVVVAGVELEAELSGVDLLASVRRHAPLARRVLLVRRGTWSSHPVRTAMVLGHADGYLFVPWMPKEQWLYLPMAEYLAEWSRDQPADLVAVTIVGRRWDDRSHHLRDLLSRASVPFDFVEPDTEAGRAALASMGLDGSLLPVVGFHTGGAAEDPTDLRMMELLGFRTDVSGLDCDVAIVGAGPSGLSAAVYGASEGLSTVVIDPGIPGGQAGTSSRIRNYLGFPRGVTGADLTTRAVEQAWLFGAELLLARTAVGLDSRDGRHVLTLADGATVAARAVVLATGVSWRRLDVDSVEDLVGSGVFYGAAGSEAAALRGEEVFVVGGGNSAGQAVVHLAKEAAHVTLVVRGPSLARSMSDYLIRELGSIANVSVRADTEVVGATGAGRLETLLLRDRRTGDTESVEAAALFVMIGAVPLTGWLPDAVARDAAGYVLTGADVPAGSGARAPMYLESSVPGVFAVGDVRHAATHRVAPSVGSGAIAISLVHEYLAGTG